MALPPKVGLDHVPHHGKGRRMCSVLKCMKDGQAITLREIQFSGSVGSKIMADYTVNLASEWLNSNCQS